jgi:hypothetical protein
MTPKAKEPEKTTTAEADPPVDTSAPYPPVSKSGGPVEVAPGQFVTPLPDAAPRRECVVDDGTLHVGRAVNGVVCSAHANRYKPDGTKRP